MSGTKRTSELAYDGRIVQIITRLVNVQQGPHREAEIIGYRVSPRKLVLLIGYLRGSIAREIASQYCYLPGIKRVPCQPT